MSAIKNHLTQSNLSLAALILVLASCSKSIEVQVPGITENSTGSQNNLLFSDVGVNDFFQVNRKFSVVTGVSYTRPDVSNQWNQVKNSLPLNNHPSNWNANAVLSLSKLAARYCTELVDRPTENQINGTPARQIVFPGFNWDQAPNLAFTAATKSALVANGLNRFWGTGLARPADAETIYLELLNSLTTGLTQAQMNPGMTRNIVIGLCTAMLISTPVTTL